LDAIALRHGLAEVFMARFRPFRELDQDDPILLDTAHADATTFGHDFTGKVILLSGTNSVLQ